jgi:hypothetical protein
MIGAPTSPRGGWRATGGVAGATHGVSDIAVLVVDMLNA